MNKLSSKLNYFVSRVDNRTINLIITIGSLALFVLAAGAPNGTGGLGR